MINIPPQNHIYFLGSYSHLSEFEACNESFHFVLSWVASAVMSFSLKSFSNDSFLFIGQLLFLLPYKSICITFFPCILHPFSMHLSNYLSIGSCFSDTKFVSFNVPLSIHSEDGRFRWHHCSILISATSIAATNS